ncbi:MAG: Gfo/Idh/MocA family oxidoreductase [Actinomycetales bacterium]|nr:Gfo/Idh/MocA family oxidoreductase [Actinomycetales bacterium]
MAPRILVIGAGRMGAIRVEDLVDHASVLVANRTPQRAHDLAERFGAAAIDVKQVTAQAVDGYVLATSTASHAGLFEALIATGRPILVEKPLALTLEESREMARLAQEAGCTVQVGFQRRFDPEIAQCQRLIADGQVGTLYSIHMMAHDHEPGPAEFIAGSGGIFEDLHVHDFDLVRWMTGSEVESVYATRRLRVWQQYGAIDDGDASLIHLTTTSGVQVAITGTRHDPVGHDVHMEVFGSQDSIAVGLGSRAPLHAMASDANFNRDPYRGFVDRFREAFRQETRAFVDLVQGERDNPCPPRAAIEATRIALACEQSARSGAVVRIDEIH